MKISKFTIFLDIDGVFSTEKSIEDLWASFVGNDNGKDNPMNFFSTLDGYPAPNTNMYHWPFDETAVYNYHRLQYHIFKEYGIIPETVLCSSWRHNYTSIEECVDSLSMKKLNIVKLVGFTGHASSRGQEIKNFIDANNIDKFLVIDDDCEYDIIPVINEENCITPKFATGFTNQLLQLSKTKIKNLCTKY